MYQNRQKPPVHGSPAYHVARRHWQASALDTAVGAAHPAPRTKWAIPVVPDLVERYVETGVRVQSLSADPGSVRNRSRSSRTRNVRPTTIFVTRRWNLYLGDELRRFEAAFGAVVP